MNSALKLFTTICLLAMGAPSFAADQKEEWITILVHGAVGFGANFSSRTICLIKHDKIEGSSYERNVTKIREHPYIYTIQPIGNLGLHPVKQSATVVNAAYAFSVLYTDLCNRYSCKEKNTFYTFGWSGLISKKRRCKEARQFYCELKELLKKYEAEGKHPKVRLIGYSHGATMFLNFAELRAKKFCQDTFCIDEAYLIGTPIHEFYRKAITRPPFKKVYNIYSKSDKIQRLDIFTGPGFARRSFLGALPSNLTQIEIRITAPLNKLPNQILPSNMRGTINQSPGHVEIWSFGWSRSHYRKNLSIYPACAGVFIPYLVHVARTAHMNNIQVDIRIKEEESIVKAFCGDKTCRVPFMSQSAFTQFINKAYTFDPSNTAFKDEFVKLQESVDITGYQ